MKTKLKNKQEEGITLIALVITIVVLLILAGVSISLVLNNNGVISKAKDSKNSTERGQAQDEVNLAINYLQIEDATSTLTQEDRRKILEDELRKISADSSVSISGLGYKITHKKYDFFVDKDLNISSSEKTFDTVEWDKKAAPEDIFIWKSDDPNNADYGVIIGYKKNVDNYTVLRFPSRCTKLEPRYSSDIYKDTGDNEPTVRSYTKNILKVEMPDTIKELGYGAFSGSSKNSLHQYGFIFSSLERVELSKSLSKIEDSAFYYCGKLNYIEIPKNITVIGSGAFCGCENLNDIEIPDNIVEIGAGAFSGCKNLNDIEIPDSVSKIGGSAFDGIKTVKIGKIVESSDGLERKALNCETLIIRDGVKKLIKCSGDFFNVEIPKSVNEIGNDCFYYNSRIKSITIPEGVKKIGDNCFYECRNLQQVNLPEGLKEIGNYCFEFCTNLQQINLPEGLEKIGSSAFEDASSLSEIIIPKSVETINSGAFGGWISKQTIKCKATEAGENWNKYWNYEWAAFQGGYIKSSCNIIWGYQDSNT